MSTLTTLAAPTLLQALLSEGRSKLASKRRAWEEEEELLAQRQEGRRLAHWHALRTRVANDLGEAAAALMIQTEMPADFASDAPLAEIEVGAAGLAPLAMLYGFGEFWERCCWDVAGGRFAYAVPTWRRDGARLARSNVRDWHYVNDLAEALALAEEVAQSLVRLRREADEEIPF